MDMHTYLKSRRDNATIYAKVCGCRVDKIFTCQYPDLDYTGFPEALYKWGIEQNFGSPKCTPFVKFNATDQDRYNSYIFMSGSDDNNNYFCEIHSAWRHFLYWVYREGKMTSLLDMMQDYFFSNTEKILNQLK